MTTPPRPQPIRLAFSALFWRLMAGLTLLFSLFVVLAVLRRVAPRQRVGFFLFLMPQFVATAFFLAASLTVAADLVVRLFIRPRLLRWLAPRTDVDAAGFHLEPREVVATEVPARASAGRAWSPGRLVLTDRRILFLPAAWDVEPWSAPRSRVGPPRLVDPPRAFWGFLRGLPPRLEVRESGGKARLFALLEPGALLGWFPPDPTPSPPPPRPLGAVER